MSNTAKAKSKINGVIAKLVTEKVPRYVELIRVSTDAQVENDTPEKQRVDLDALRLRRPGVLVKRIEAPGVSGTLSISESAEGRELQALAAANAFDELRIVKINRVFGARSADPSHQSEVAGLCFRLGARIVEAAGQEYNPRDPISMIMLGIALGFSSKERSDLVEGTNKGRFAKAKAGQSPGGRHYIGRRFNSTTKQWEIHPEQKKIFDQIKQWTLVEHVSLNEVARRLNRMGVPTMLSADRGMPEHKLKRPRRLKWHGKTVSNMLRARHLVGEAYYHNMYVPDDEATIPLPALLTEDEWQQIQTYLDTRRITTRPVDPSRSPILIGRIRCICGERMYEKSGFYYCSTGHSNNRVMGRTACEHVKYHRYAEVDAAAWGAITAYVTKDVLAEVADPDNQLDIARFEDEVVSFEGELAALKRREANVGKTYAEGNMGDDAWRTTHKALKATQGRVTSQLHAAQQTILRLRASQGATESLEAAIKGVRARITSATPADRRALIQAVVPDVAGYGITLKPNGELVIDAGLLGTAAAGGSHRARMDKLGKSASPSRRRRR